MLLENSLWLWVLHQSRGHGDDIPPAPQGLGGLEARLPYSLAVPGHRGTELHRPKSCSWEMAEVGFELQAPESGTAGGTVGPGSGRCCPDLPVTPDTTSPFCPEHSAHRKPGGGLPCPSCLQRVDMGSWRHPPPPRASLFLSCARQGVPCVEWAGGSGGWVDG